MVDCHRLRSTMSSVLTFSMMGEIDNLALLHFLQRGKNVIGCHEIAGADFIALAHSSCSVGQLTGFAAHCPIDGRREGLGRGGSTNLP